MFFSFGSDTHVFFTMKDDSQERSIGMNEFVMEQWARIINIQWKNSSDCELYSFGFVFCSPVLFFTANAGSFCRVACLWQIRENIAQIQTLVKRILHYTAELHLSRALSNYLKHPLIIKYLLNTVSQANAWFWMTRPQLYLHTSEGNIILLGIYALPFNAWRAEISQPFSTAHPIAQPFFQTEWLFSTLNFSLHSHQLNPHTEETSGNSCPLKQGS